jgi:hypothetical protein
MSINICSYLYITYLNNLRYEILISFSVFALWKLYFTAVKHFFRTFTGLNPDCFLLNPYPINDIGDVSCNRKVQHKKVYNKQKSFVYKNGTYLHLVVWKLSHFNCGFRNRWINYITIKITDFITNEKENSIYLLCTRLL